MHLGQSFAFVAAHLAAYFRNSMGCGPSKADQAVEEPQGRTSVEEPKGSASPNDVQLQDAKKVNAAGRRVSKTVRRVAVRAETQEDMGEEDFVPQTTEKTAEQAERIMAGINNSELLSGLSDEQKELVKGALI